eukprot:TRINITY_DN6116_c0_g1_i7.p1 TRINITY_DN6116_c0_g1~~TRINITY_DN6116_c0_g1_i7.p1  ORF type:complete len:136 (-),score=9.82 TRINITY_DN6116_c0_g1_i7:717-1124(-)
MNPLQKSTLQHLYIVSTQPNTPLPTRTHLCSDHFNSRSISVFHPLLSTTHLQNQSAGLPCRSEPKHQHHLHVPPFQHCCYQTIPSQALITLLETDPTSAYPPISSPLLDRNTASPLHASSLHLPIPPSENQSLQP